MENFKSYNVDVPNVNWFVNVYFVSLFPICRGSQPVGRDPLGGREVLAGGSRRLARSSLR